MKKVSHRAKFSMIGLVLTLSFGLAACGSNNNNTKTRDDSMKGMDHSSMNEGEKEDNKNTSGMKHSKAPISFNENATNGLMTMNTKNVTRIDTSDPIKMAVTVSQTIWPATHKENQPGGVILVPTGSWQIDVASADLIHHPNNGPILFINKDSIPNMTLNEIKRLNPIGIKDGTQVMIMGEVSDAVLDSLKGYKVKQIKDTDIPTFAKEVDKTYADTVGEYPQSVIIGSSDEDAKLYTIPAINWISHMPEPLLYVTKSEVPQATIDALKERKGKANIYLLGPKPIISEDVEKKLGEYGKVTRISGKNPVENSIAFAKFKDKKTKFGWGISNPGHGISFASTSTYDLAIAGAPFSHMGKHAPLILLENGEPTQPIYDFLGSIKPMYKESPTEGPYNHAFLLGTEKEISFKTQGILDDQLEIMSQNGMNHSGM
ncbi:cell wall-binding repeat-containing protein [Bacillus sp. S13(2024)]|uniref:cell wall-binding repeat-containing protein n=1 Tax=unclassified Bacillus (in: firmicutes) TaxID=185979 RepID=UPI003D2234FF